MIQVNVICQLKACSLKFFRKPDIWKSTISVILSDEAAKQIRCIEEWSSSGSALQCPAFYSFE